MLLAFILLLVVGIVAYIIWQTPEASSTNSSTSTSTSSSTSSSTATHTYEFSIAEWPAHNGHRHHIASIKADGAFLPAGSIALYAPPNDPAWDETKSVVYGAGHAQAVGDVFMTITTKNKVQKFEITYSRRLYCPGFVIKEDGVIKATTSAEPNDDSLAWVKSYEMS